MANIGSLNQQVSILPFDGENYDFWFVKMKTIFKSLGLWESVVEGFTEPNTTEGMTENQKKKLDEKRQKDASALSLIQRNVTDPIFPRIMRVESAKEAWETLRNEFQGDHKVRAIKLQSLRKDLENMKMKEDESLKDYSSRFLELINQMKTHGEDISDRRIVEKTLISLPEKFDPIIAVIEETKDLSTLSVQEVMASLKSYEQRMARHTQKAVESAFQSKLNVGSKSQERKPQNFDQPKGESSRGGRYGRGRGRNRGRGRGNFGRSYNSENNSKPCGVCKKMSHNEKDCWFKGQPQCHRCKKFGHMQKDGRVKLHQQASFTEEKESEASLFYACQSATEKNDEMWFLDSGCSNHMAREKSLFLDMDSTINTKVKLGNGTIVQAQGKGSIGVQTKQGTRFIRDVLLVPDLEHNLLSLGQLLENDYTLQFQDKCCIIYDKKGSKDVVRKIKMEKNRSFPINFRYTSGVAMKASIVEDSWLWHRRVFGHDSVWTEFCSAVVTLLGQSVRTRFCSDRILFGHGHSAPAECSDTILLGKDSVRSLPWFPPRVSFINVFERELRIFKFLYSACDTSSVSSSEESSSSSSSERVPTSGSEVGTSNPQLPLASTSHPFQPSTSQPLPPSSSQPSHSLSRKNALGDVKYQADDKANPKPWYTADEKSGKMSTKDLQDLIREYPLPECWYARLPGLQEPANYGTKFETGIYEEQVKSGYRLPLHPFALRFFEHYRMAPGQLVPNGWRKLVGLIYLVQTSGYKPDATDFMRVFFKICFVKGVANCPGWYYIHSRQRLLKGGPKSNKGWHSRYFFVGRLDKEELPFDRDWNPF
ncbi:hypothetical protein RJ639_014055 [Escallonia herrerae]|uniref:DUF4219 domain-containing protein n=1 Tax=Escallonia herrerae TaxID=1293975 RepID=A0AA89AMH6_9ASTE|nr:hypothetical protein RJ639_014055 [Escallonia herrerae]